MDLDLKTILLCQQSGNCCDSLRHFTTSGVASEYLARLDLGIYALGLGRCSTGTLSSVPDRTPIPFISTLVVLL